MKPPRLTIKRAMLLVAVVALALGIPLEAGRLLKLRAGYLHDLAQSERWEAIYRRTTQGWQEELDRFQATGDDPDGIARASQAISGSVLMTEVLAKRVALYRRLASHPWETVPEPPKRDEEPPVLIFRTPAGAGLEFSPALLGRLSLAVVPLGGLVCFAGWKRLMPARSPGIGEAPTS